MLIFAPVRQAILIAFALAASLLIAQQAHAQTSINISGHVKDGNSAPLSDVTITVQSSAPTATTNTDSSGNYSFTNVPAGPGTTVTVTASRPGYLFSPRRYEYQHERDNKIANFTGGQPTPVSAGDVLISEFRTRGPNGEQDEFVELYNNTDHPITVQAPDGSGGWTITSLTSDGSSVTVPFTINDGTTLPPRGHYLGASSPFFIGGYGLTNYAVPDNLLGAVGGGLADFTGIALFKTATPANRTLANRLDAVGFTGPTGPLADLHREGVGLTPADSSNQSSFVRRMLTGLVQDTNDNASDFVFVTTGLNRPLLGAPGPENLSSPLQRNAQIKASLIDPQSLSSASPNRVRNSTPVTNGQFGTLKIRRRFTNLTNGTINRLRFRVVDITNRNSPNPGGTQADLRVVPSTTADFNVTLSDGLTVVPVKGTQVEQAGGQLAQPNGGGLNSSIVTISMATPLPVGEAVNIEFNLGVQQNGLFRFFVNVEALSSAPTSTGATSKLTLKKARAK